MTKLTLPPSQQEKLPAIDPPAWSTDLLYKLSVLTAKQRKAVLMIVAGEAAQIPLSRLLKTSYSCCWCGRQVGRSGESTAVRQSRKSLHESQCQAESKRFYWTFAASSATYYVKWLRDERFTEALALARQEMSENALTTAARLLQIGTAAAARELVRQVAEGEKDADKRQAAVALLDRADVMTAEKSRNGQELAAWRRALRES